MNEGPSSSCLLKTSILGAGVRCLVGQQEGQTHELSIYDEDNELDIHSTLINERSFGIKF